MAIYTTADQCLSLLGFLLLLNIYCQALLTVASQGDEFSGGQRFFNNI